MRCLASICLYREMSNVGGSQRHSLKRTTNVFGSLFSLAILFLMTHAEHHVWTLHQQNLPLQSAVGPLYSLESTAWQILAPKKYALSDLESHWNLKANQTWVRRVHSLWCMSVLWRPNLCSNFRMPLRNQIILNLQR